MQPQVSPVRPDGSTTIVVLLSLYLLLLAFFILLTSLSSFDKGRSERVAEGLSSAFSSPDAEAPGMFSSDVGNIVGGNPFLDHTAALFATAIPAARIRVIESGRLMQVTMLAEALFLEGTARLRPAQGAVLDRLVAAASVAPVGVRYEIEFVIGSEYGDGRQLPIGDSLAMARAGAFAREMTARGASPDGLVAGLEHGDPRGLRIMFRVVEADDARSDIPAAGP